MATAKLGIIVTEIAGTIGGVTFRRHRGTTVVGIKSVGGSKSILLQNPRLGNLRTLVNNWGLLPVVTRDNWDTAALLFTFPDKFGDQRNLSGRELYLKLQGHLIVIGGSALDPTTLTSAINLGVNPLLYISISGGLNYLSDFSVNLDGLTTGNTTFIANVSNIFGLSQVLSISPTIDNINHFLRIPQSVSQVIDGNIFRLTGKFLILSTNTVVKGMTITNDIVVIISGDDLFSNVQTNTWLNFTIVYESRGFNIRLMLIDVNNNIVFIGDINDKIYFRDIMIQDQNGFNSTLNFDDSISDTNVLLQTELLKNNAIAPTFTRRQIFAFKNMNAVSLFDFSSLLLEKFPEIKIGDLIRIYITYQNLSGFRTVPITLETNVIE